MEQLDNPKHENFVLALIKHKGNQTKAYQEVYPDASPESARRSASLLMTILDIRERFSGLLEAQGLGVLRLNNKLGRLMKAKKAIIVGESIHYVPDNHVRLETLKVAYKLHGFHWV